MSVSRLFILWGIVFITLGTLFFIGPKIPGLRHLGHLPGDISFRGERFSVYLPVVTCLLISLLLTFLFQLFQYFKSR